MLQSPAWAWRALTCPMTQALASCLASLCWNPQASGSSVASPAGELIVALEVSQLAPETQAPFHTLALGSHHCAEAPDVGPAAVS